MEIIFIILLWKKCEICEVIKAITKELEPGIRKSLMHLPHLPSYIITIYKIKV